MLDTAAATSAAQSRRRQRRLRLRRRRRSRGRSRRQGRRRRGRDGSSCSIDSSGTSTVLSTTFKLLLDRDIVDTALWLYDVFCCEVTASVKVAHHSHIAFGDSNEQKYECKRTAFISSRAGFVSSRFKVSRRKCISSYVFLDWRLQFLDSSRFKVSRRKCILNYVFLIGGDNFLVRLR